MTDKKHFKAIIYYFNNRVFCVITLCHTPGCVITQKITAKVRSTAEASYKLGDRDRGNYKVFAGYYRKNSTFVTKTKKFLSNALFYTESWCVLT
ncbi:MAG TPA: hypothetical protein VLA84_13790 [Microcoleus sp.]|nr:hypothetical protein [Microcoleus sp.]